MRGSWEVLLEGRDHENGDDFIRTGGLDDHAPHMYVAFCNQESPKPAGAAVLDFIA